MFSSPLSRAKRTAELAGFAPEIEPDLLEWNYGDYEGKTSVEIAATAPGLDTCSATAPRRRDRPQVVERGGPARREAEGADRQRALLRARAHPAGAGGAVDRPVADASAPALLLGTATLSVLSFNHSTDRRTGDQGVEQLSC